MNRIYRVIRDPKTGDCADASELAQARGKSGRKVVSTVLGLTAALGGTGIAQAQSVTLNRDATVVGDGSGSDPGGWSINGGLTISSAGQAGALAISGGGSVADNTTSTVSLSIGTGAGSTGNASTIAMDGERLSRDLPKNTCKAKVDAQLELGQGWSGWCQVGYQQGSNGYRDLNGQVGVKLSW